MLTIELALALDFHEPPPVLFAQRFIVPRRALKRGLAGRNPLGDLGRLLVFGSGKGSVPPLHLQLPPPRTVVAQSLCGEDVDAVGERGIRRRRSCVGRVGLGLNERRRDPGGLKAQLNRRARVPHYSEEEILGADIRGGGCDGERGLL